MDVNCKPLPGISRTEDDELEMRWLIGLASWRGAMKIWTILFAIPVALLPCPALAENWVTVAVNDDECSSISVDKDTIRRGADGLVYFANDELTESSAEAADCSKRVLYTISSDLIIGKHIDFSDWRDHGEAVQSNSMGESELQMFAQMPDNRGAN